MVYAVRLWLALVAAALVVDRAANYVKQLIGDGLLAVCKIHVGEISDYVKSWGGSSSVTSLNGYKFVSFGVSISNKLASSITLTGMKMTDVSTGSTIVNYTFKESDATIASGESKTFSASKNGTYVSYFGFIITYTYNGATYTTECSYNFDK